MYKYELGIVLLPTLGDEEKLAAYDKVKAVVERFGGEITKEDDWGKRRLAYEIDKITEGFYYFIQYSAAGDVPPEIESRIRIMDEVMRYLTIRLEDEEE